MRVIEVNPTFETYDMVGILIANAIIDTEQGFEIIVEIYKTFEGGLIVNFSKSVFYMKYSEDVKIFEFQTAENLKICIEIVMDYCLNSSEKEKYIDIIKNKEVVDENIYKCYLYY